MIIEWNSGKADTETDQEAIIRIMSDGAKRQVISQIVPHIPSYFWKSGETTANAILWKIEKDTTVHTVVE